MPHIIPFRGITYKTAGGDFSDYIAPPYDVIDEKYRERLLQRCPYNFVRLTVKTPDEQDFFARVRKQLNDWISTGILMADSVSRFYFLREKFCHENRLLERTGFFALVDLKSQDIVRHEVIFDRYKTQRRKLLDATRANLEPIFLLYEDRQFIIENTVEKEQISSGILENVQIQFGAIRHCAGMERLIRTVEKQPVFIADGHHRFEASLNYYLEDPEKNPGYILAYFLNAASDGLVVLPTHRLIPERVDFESCIHKAEQYFIIRKFQDKNSLFARLNAASKCSFAVYSSGEFYLWKLRDFCAVERMLPQEHSREWKHLDVVILHYFILKHLLGLDPEKQLFYERDPDAIIKKADEIPGSVAFFLKRPDIKKIWSISSRGEIMPPKTTYFFPKVPSGLVFVRFE
jgi:uncharacterized protein (DUF1015 family)